MEEATAVTKDGTEQALDVTGLACPLPVLKARQALGRMAAGQVLRVSATDPHSVVDFRAFCARSAHELLGQVEEQGVFHFRIRRGA